MHTRPGRDHEARWRPCARCQARNSSTNSSPISAAVTPLAAIQALIRPTWRSSITVLSAV